MKAIEGTIKKVEIELEYQTGEYILDSIGKYVEDILEGIGYIARVSNGNLTVTYRGPAKEYESSKKVMDTTVNMIMKKVLDLNNVVKSRADLDLLRHERGNEKI